MLYDIHVHLAGTDTARTGNFIHPRQRRRLWMRVFLRNMGLRGFDPAAGPLEVPFFERTLAWMEHSRVDRFVALALDGCYTCAGDLDEARTQVMVSNDYVADLAAQHPRMLFGASIHPLRRHAQAEAERVYRRGACLVKWIPSAQGFRPDDPACEPFLKTLADLGLPLLCHLGREHALPGRDASANDPQRLRRALDLGVTVIGAHCGARLYLHEPDAFGAWARLALEYPNLYGDTAALGVPTRMSVLRRLARQPKLLAKVLYGSDFPGQAWPWSLLLRVGLRRASELAAMANPFDKSYATIASAGMPPAVFTRAGAVLRLPPDKKEPARHEH